MDQTGISFGTWAGSSADLPDEAFLRSVRWRRSAPERVVSAAARGDVAGFCDRLRRQARKRPPRMKSAAGVLAPLLHPLWSQHAFDAGVMTERFVEGLTTLERISRKRGSREKPSRRVSRIVGSCLDEGMANPTEDPFALLVLLTLLTELPAALDDTQCFRLWRLTFSGVLAQTAVTSSDCDPTLHDDQWLLTRGEIPWRSGLLFGEVRGAGKLLRSGQCALRRQLDEMTDTDGSPHARLLERLPLAIAVCTRSMYAGEVCGEPLWNHSTRDRFERLIERSTALCQPDGRLALSNGASFAPVSLLRTASRLVGLKSTEGPVQRLSVLPDDRSLRSAKGRRRSVKLRSRGGRPRPAESPSSQSDWAELTCMRNNWWPGSDSCVIAHHESEPRLYLTVFDTPLLEGRWKTQTCIADGAPTPEGEWGSVCWFSDDDADYVELQRDYADAVTLTRQALLSRTDHFLFLADCLTISDERPIRHSFRLPLAAGTSVRGETRSRRLKVSAGEIVATVYPLGLEEDRVVRAHGRIAIEEGHLVLEQTTVATGLYLPLVIDWSPDRRRSDATWRRLTVAEDGAVVPADQAGGYRLRIGAHQWVFFRNLRRGRSPRTVLGHHTACETVIGEFTAEGEVEPTVMVE